MAKRVVFRITFDRTIGLWLLKKAGESGVLAQSVNKKVLIKEGRTVARNAWVIDGQPTQLSVRGKDGRISFENTYGRDPKRYPG